MAYLLTIYNLIKEISLVLPVFYLFCVPAMMIWLV